MALSIALFLDALFGEPDWLWSRLPHPAVVMGRLVHRCDMVMNRGAYRKAKGVVALIVLVTLSGLVGFAISLLPLHPFPEILVAAILLAQKSLADHVSAVARGLRLSLAEGRSAVAMIVGRDTAELEPPGIVRAAIESAAENLSDGVIAPAFWFAVAGLPGLLVYKMVNTADSMIGYRTERYDAFGWASARFDDLLNLLPARLTALLIAGCYGLLGVWREIAEEARRHRSPNAGWPEAAMARALDVALSGPRFYDGALHDEPFVNPGGRTSSTADDIDASVRALWRVWGAFLAIVVLVSLLRALMA